MDSKRSVVREHAHALPIYMACGAAFALVCRAIVKASDKPTTPVCRAVLGGAASGLRSMTGLSVGIGREKPFTLTSSMLCLLAVGELVADKLPSIPARIEPAPLAARAITGGISGAMAFRSEHENPLAGAALGAAAAVGAAYAGYHLRKAATDYGVPKLAYALAEDALALSLARGS